MSVTALLMVPDRPASPFFPFLSRQHSLNDHLNVLRAADGQGSDSSRASSPLKRRTVRWNRNKWSREPSQTDASNSDYVQLDEQDFPLSHTRTIAVDADNVECDDSDCEIGYHSDTAIDIRVSKLITLRHVHAAQQARLYDQRDDNEDTDDGLEEPYEPAELPRHTYPRDQFVARRRRLDSDDDGSHNMDVDVDSLHHDEYEDDDEEEMESEYEAPILRKRKRKMELSVAGRPRTFTASGRVPRAKFTISGPPSVGTPDAELSPVDALPRPVPKKNPSHRRNHGKRPRLEAQAEEEKPQQVVPGVLEFPCPYVSPEGKACTKKFPRWTDYEKHYESFHTGDSGYPWSSKVEAKDCPFRCPHPIPSASRPKSNKGRLVKTVEYGACDFVTRKNTHDFERHWKGNHIRSEALFIARGNMNIDDAKWVNVKEKFEIAYALCPRCPRCSENFTRTDALTRHLRSPCSGGSVGAAIDENNLALPQPVQFVEVRDAKSVKEMIEAQQAQAQAQAAQAQGTNHLVTA